MTDEKIVVIDTETTGLDPVGCGVVEVAWVVVGSETMEIEETGSTFLHWPGLIPPEARAIHHISPEDVADLRLPSRAEAEEIINTLAGGAGFVAAHNAGFDSRFMPGVVRPWICTWRCALHLWPEAPAHSNQVLRYWLGLELDLPEGLYPHRALYDTLTTAEILKVMLATGVGVEELLRLSSAPVMLKTVRFGKHRGEPWGEVPSPYLRWCLNNLTDIDAIYTAQQTLANRELKL